MSHSFKIFFFVLMVGFFQTAWADGNRPAWDLGYGQQPTPVPAPVQAAPSGGVILDRRLPADPRQVWPPISGQLAQRSAPTLIQPDTRRRVRAVLQVGMKWDGRRYGDIIDRSITQIERSASYGQVQIVHSLDHDEVNSLIDDVQSSGRYSRGRDAPRAGRYEAPNFLLAIQASANFVEYEKSDSRRDFANFLTGVLSRDNTQQSHTVRRRVCLVELTPILIYVEGRKVVPLPFAGSRLLAKNEVILNEASEYSSDSSWRSRSKGRYYQDGSSYGLSCSDNFRQSVSDDQLVWDALQDPLNQLVGVIQSLPAEIPVVEAPPEDLGAGNFSLREAQVLDGGDKILVSGVPQGLLSVGDTVTLPLADSSGRERAGQAITAKVVQLGQNGKIILEPTKVLGSSQIYKEGVGQKF